MLRDPATFPEPSRFNPERWLEPGAPAFPDAAFGFGRRECPGRFMARDSCVGCHRGRAGGVRDFAGGGRSAEGALHVWNRRVRYFFILEFCSAAIREFCSSYPEPFKCLVRPRSEAIVALVRATANES
jgi:hypothetical protein